VKVLDKGHLYELNCFDGISPLYLRFVKRDGLKYPGNIGCYPGTTTQEVLRVLSDRSRYVNGQNWCIETARSAQMIQGALFYLENRAARLHGRAPMESHAEAEFGVCCCVCGHVGCNGECRSPESSPHQFTSTPSDPFRRCRVCGNSEEHKYHLPAAKEQA
jgi:hypothetical protein